MIRPLNDYEIQDLIERNPAQRVKVTAHEALFGYYGWQNWDQVRGDVDQYGIPLPIPPRGITVRADAVYGDVVIFPDAHGVLRYSAIENPSLVNEIEKPVYTSDPDYWSLFEDIAKRFGEFTIDLTKVAIVAAVVVGAFLLRPYLR